MALFILAFSVIFSLSAHADGLEPDLTLLPTSAKQAFVMDAQLPAEYWHALDDRSYLAITGFSVGEHMIAAAGQSLMDRPDHHTCSVYDSTVCYDLSKFYESTMPQILISGFFMLNGNTAITWGLDSGYRSEKLTVTPAVLIGLSKRWFFSEKRDSQFIVEASGWAGQSVSHTPCIDSQDRLYYCGTLSAWSDFSYDPHPTDLYLKVWYEKAF